jgi:hypothetical protein
VDKEVSAKASELFTRDDSYVSKSKTKSTFYPNGYGIEPNFTPKPQIMDSSLKSTAAAGIIFSIFQFDYSYYCLFM